MTRPECESLIARIGAGEYNNEVRGLVERALGMLLRGFSEFDEERQKLRAKLDAVTSERDVLAQQVDELTSSDDEDEADADAAEDEDEAEDEEEETPPSASKRRKR